MRQDISTEEQAVLADSDTATVTTFETACAALEGSEGPAEPPQSIWIIFTRYIDLNRIIQLRCMDHSMRYVQQLRVKINPEGKWDKTRRQK